MNWTSKVPTADEVRARKQAKLPTAIYVRWSDGVVNAMALHVHFITGKVLDESNNVVEATKTREFGEWVPSPIELASLRSRSKSVADAEKTEQAQERVLD